MSYCRFSEGDVYLFYHVDGFFQCCSCSMAPCVPTIFTEGCEDHPLFGHVEPCESCKGEGCQACMMHGNAEMQTAEDALAHLLGHRDAGHEVPDDAIERLREEIAEGPIQGEER